jgi:hypothetical protein
MQARGGVMDRRPPLTARDLPAVVACYAVVWVPIVALLLFPDTAACALYALLLGP